jgi:hypothetical protein
MVKANRQKLLDSEIDHLEFWANWSEAGRAIGIPQSPKRIERYSHYMGHAIANFEAESLFIAFEKADMAGWTRYVQDHPPTPEALAVLMLVAVGEANKTRSKEAADKGHSKEGGTRDKQEQMRSIWASGISKSRAHCAEKHSEKIGMSIETGKKALRNTPDPDPWPAKPYKKKI